MSQKCVRQGCGKLFNDATEESCKYHSGPPIFHEGQKGWKCCKPRVLTFDEFLAIPPCTTGTHSTTAVPTPFETSSPVDEDELNRKISALNASASAASAPLRKPLSTAQATPPPPPPPAESSDDDATLEIPDGKTCRRRACNVAYKKGPNREGEKCVHHPGQPIFHEGSKGYSCCKRRVLEFDEFMKIEGCTTKERHLFIGKGNKGKATGGAEEVLETVRRDFYQTTNTVIASFFLKKINKETSKVDFAKNAIKLNLVTSDPTPKRFTKDIPTFGPIDPAKTTFKILGTKLEVTLAKSDGISWPVLSNEDPHTGEILQVGRAGQLQA